MLRTMSQRMKNQAFEQRRIRLLASLSFQGTATMIEVRPTDLSLAIGNSVPITKSNIIIPRLRKGVQ